MTSRVSFTASKTSVVGVTSTTVRQAPFTATESPTAMPSVTAGASTAMRVSSPRGVRSITRPTLSTIPVNTEP